MDKEKATRALAKELVKANGQTFVTDTAHKKHLLEKAVAYHPVEFEKPFTFRFQIDFLSDSNNTLSQNKRKNIEKDYRKGMTEGCSQVSDANYIFVESSQSFSMAGKYSDTSCLSLMNNFSFFALVGEKEVNNLQRMFYKDVDLNIVRAMETLKIKPFISDYKSYKKDSYFGRNYRPQEGGLDSFLEFVFTIPYEEQNLENNKDILSRYTYRVDYVEILLREYSNGKYFQDYFGCLGSDNKRKVFDSLKSVKERSPIHDSFLWYAGFKELHLDHLELYKSDTKKFIDYFNNRSREEKKVMIKDIMSYDSTNDEAIEWLNKNYLDLIREVGMNG